MSKKSLAEQSGASTRALTSYELGERTPSAETIELLARALDFPVSFFYGDDIEEFTQDSASFRSLSRMTAAQRDSALAAGAFAVRLGRWIDERFNLPEPSLPEYYEGADAVGAAVHLRSAWGLGSRPIKNVIHLLESRGVHVFSLVEDCREVDAFSLWDGSTPYVLLNTKKTAERSRFDAAHELGHLVLHRHNGATGRTAEDEANAFASAFLMPEAEVKARAPVSPSLQSISEGRLVWGVSTVAYTVRLRKLGMLTDWYYHQLMQRLSAMGLRSGESKQRPRETSQVLQKVFEQLREEGVTKAQVAEQLEISSAELDRLIFGLVMTGIQGGSSSSTPSSGRSHLRLV